MTHCFNIRSDQAERFKRKGFTIGRPKPTQCQTVEQLEALNLIGAYSDDPDVTALSEAATTSVS